MTIVKVNRHDAYEQVREYLKPWQKDDVYFNIEIKRWRALKTKKELGLLFKAIEHLIRGMNSDMTHYISSEEKLFVERGLVEKYGERRKTGLIVIDGYGNEVEQEVPIPLSECNRFEQFNKVFVGCIQEAATQTPAVDMTGFFEQWEAVKKEEQKREAKNNEDKRES